MRPIIRRRRRGRIDRLYPRNLRWQFNAARAPGAWIGRASIPGCGRLGQAGRLRLARSGGLPAIHGLDCDRRGLAVLSPPELPRSTRRVGRLRDTLWRAVREEALEAGGPLSCATARTRAGRRCADRHMLRQAHARVR